MHIFGLLTHILKECLTVFYIKIYAYKGTAKINSIKSLLRANKTNKKGSFRSINVVKRYDMKRPRFWIVKLLNDIWRGWKFVNSCFSGIRNHIRRINRIFKLTFEQAIFPFKPTVYDVHNGTRYHQGLHFRYPYMYFHEMEHIWDLRIIWINSHLR